MPFAWNADPDSPQVFEAIGSFAGGMVSNSKPRLLAEDQWSLLQNMEIAITGQGSTRFGTATVGNSPINSTNSIGAVAYLNSPTNQLEFAISNDTTYALSGTWTTVGGPMSTVDMPSITQGFTSHTKLGTNDGKLFFAGGGDIWSYDGTTQTGDGVISTDGTATGPRHVSIVLWHNNRLLAAGPNITDTATGTPKQPDAIYFSNVLDATTWGATKVANTMRVGAGDGIPITALVPWTELNLAVFKRRSVWVVNADPATAVADMPIRLVHATVGCVARNTAVQVGADIFFLSDDGVRSLSSVIGSDTQHKLSVPLSHPVGDYIARINPAAVSKAAAVFWRNLYILSVPLDTSTINNTVLVYNTLTESWSGVWTGLNINCFAVRLVSGSPRLMMGLSDTNSRVIDYNDYANIVNWTNTTFQDHDGTQIQPLAKSRSFMFDEPIAYKVGIGGELEVNNSDGNVNIDPYLDEVGHAGTQVSVSGGGVTLPATLPISFGANGLSRKAFDLMQFGEFRELQYNIYGASGGRKEFRQVSSSAVVRPSRVGYS